MKFFLIIFILLYPKHLPCQENNVAAWTFMVYLAADNDLEEAAIEDFLEMAEIGSSKEVNIVVQFDRHLDYTSSFGNWSKTLRFYITKEMTPATSNAIADLGEINMADKNNLRDFIIWAKNKYPAQNYALILWDHGDGWYYRYHKKQFSKALIVDDNSKDIMDLDELKEALSRLGNFKLDIIGFDACLMGMMEVAYQIKDYATYMVASANIEESFGWCYDKFLDELVNVSPQMSAEELAENIVYTYEEHYPTQWQYFTLSAIDLTKITDLAETIDSAAKELMKLRKDKITEARNNCIEYKIEEDEYKIEHIDLYDFVKKLDIEGTIKNNIKGKFNECVIKNVSGDKIIDSGGLAIYFPQYYYDRSYSNLVYSKERLWDNFLRYYLGEDLSKEPKIVVYPNPCLSNKITFEVDVKPKSIKIYDISGSLIKILKDYNYEKENKVYKFIWEIPDYITGGTYIYYLEGDISWGHLFIIR